MSEVRKHRERLRNIPRRRVFSIGEGINDACMSLAFDPCPDSWKTLLFKLKSGFKEVRQFCPEISVETDHAPVCDR